MGLAANPGFSRYHEVKLTRFGGAVHAITGGFRDAKTRPPYSPEFRRQMVDLVRAGRDPEDLAREFEPTAQSIRHWVGVADRRDSHREERSEVVAPSERDELVACVIDFDGSRRLIASRPKRSMCMIEPVILKDAGH